MNQLRERIQIDTVTQDSRAVRYPKWRVDFVSYVGVPGSEQVSWRRSTEFRFKSEDEAWAAGSEALNVLEKSLGA